MSLLNQVLQDLEQGNPSKTSGSKNIFDQVKAPSPAKSNHIVAIILLLAALISLAFAAYQFILPSITNDSVQAPVFIKNTSPTPVLTTVEIASPLSDVQTIHDEIAQPILTEVSPATPGEAVIEPVAETKKELTQAPEAAAPSVKDMAAKAVAIAEIKPKLESKTVVNNVEPIKVVTTEKIIEKPKTIKKKVAVQAKPAPTVAPTPKKITKITTLSPKQKADRLFSEAQKSLSLDKKKALLQQVLALNSGHIEAHVLIARTYLQQGSTTNAIHSLEKSVQLIPNNSALLKALAALLLKNKQGKEALDHLLNIRTDVINDERFNG